jgi:plastocyanin
MFKFLAAALALTALIPCGTAAQEGEQDVGKTVEITRKDGRLVFLERGKARPAAVTIVVGQTVRWVNKDTEPHHLVGTRRVQGKPLFETGTIPPGGHKDVVFDIDFYRSAGGKPANVVTVQYQCPAHPGEEGELSVLSAARR